MNKFNKLAVFALVAVSAGTAFCATDPLITAGLADTEGILTDFVASIIPVMVTVLTAAVGIWLVPKIVRGLKSAFSSGGGR